MQCIDCDVWELRSPRMNDLHWLVTEVEGMLNLTIIDLIEGEDMSLSVVCHDTITIEAIECLYFDIAEYLLRNGRSVTRLTMVYSMTIDSKNNVVPVIGINYHLGDGDPAITDKQYMADLVINGLNGKLQTR